MPSAVVNVRLVSGPLPEPELSSRPDAGAELIFHGRVRAGEGGREIRALFYEHYLEMAERSLDALAREIVAEHGLLELSCLHRVGEVPLGEASLRVTIRSGHRREAIDALDAFVRRLKEDVPIWKWGVAPDGTRFPSDARR